MRRSIIPITCATAAFLLVTLLISTQAMTNQRLDDIAPTVVPTEAPTEVPTVAPTVIPTPVFSATMAIVPSQSQVAISDTLVVTVSISVSDGCSFPIYELTLQQLGDDGLIFEYLSPPTHTVGPPVTNPFSYTLTAISTGTVTFSGQAYGERYCGDYWNWRNVNGESEFVRVGGWPYRVYVPMIYRD